MSSRSLFLIDKDTYFWKMLIALRGSVAQLVEHLTFNQVALGSSPSRPTIKSVSYGDVTSLISPLVTLL